MEKVTKNDATTIENEAVIDEKVVNEPSEALADYVETNLFVKRESFESNKDKGKLLYGYNILVVINRVDGLGRKEFNVNVLPNVNKDKNGEVVKDLGIYSLLDIAFVIGVEQLPLYACASSFKNDSGEIIKVRKYCVACKTDLGEFVVPFVPRGKSDRIVLELATSKFLK